MTDREALFSASVRGWFYGCVAATTVLFLHGLVLTILEPDGLSFKLLLVGLFLGTVHFTFIATFTAVPAGIFMWVTHKLRLEFLVLFAGFGGALGYLGNYLFNPFIKDRILWHFVVAGAAAGIAAWYFKRVPRS
jgi:hypothetical protein